MAGQPFTQYRGKTMNFTETENLVDFGLGLYAKEYYEAARILKNNRSKGTPYHLMLAISAECFLKSIRQRRCRIARKQV